MWESCLDKRRLGVCGENVEGIGWLFGECGEAV